MSLLPLFQWAAQASVFGWLRDSKWGFAVVEMVHLLALAVLGGVILIVDFRTLGIVLRRKPAAEIARELNPLFFASLGAMIISGTLLVAAEPLKCYYHSAFRWKMAFLAAALIYGATIHRVLVRSSRSLTSGITQKLASIVSLVLWLCVGLAGRAIGFL